MRLKEWRRRLSDPLVYFLAASALRVFGSCSDRMSERLGRWVGGLVWRMHGSGRRLVLANLAIAFPERDADERQRIGRASFVNMVWSGIEYLRSVRHPETICERVEVTEGMARIFKAGEPPVLLVLAHLGSWELLGHALPAAGSAGYAVAHRLRNPHLDRLVLEARGATGLGIIPSKGAVRGLLKAYREGKHVAVLIDQNTRLKEGGVFADLFGLPVTVTRAPAMLARKLDMRVVAGACVREGGQFKAYTVPLERSAAGYESDEALTQAMVSALESLIRRYPEQYVWLYKRWRYIPVDAPPEVAAQYPPYARLYEEGTGRWTES